MIRRRTLIKIWMEVLSMNMWFCPNGKWKRTHMRTFMLADQRPKIRSPFCNSLKTSKFCIIYYCKLISWVNFSTGSICLESLSSVRPHPASASRNAVACTKQTKNFSLTTETKLVKCEVVFHSHFNFAAQLAHFNIILNLQNERDNNALRLCTYLWQTF